MRFLKHTFSEPQNPIMGMTEIEIALNLHATMLGILL